MRFVSAIYDDCYPFELFFECETYSTRDPNELKQGDVLIVHGGEDISPALYNNIKHPHGHGSEQPSIRDQIEWGMMKRAAELGCPIIGLCRGAQMLCALAGGSLIQDVNNHYSWHKVYTRDGDEFTTNSIHHQMMAPGNAEYELLAWADNKSAYYHHTINGEPEVEVDHPDLEADPEFIYFPKVKGLAIQWHPEMMVADCPATSYVVKKLKGIL